MTDKQTMPVDGDGHDKGKADGIAAAPDGSAPHGRTPGGESGGGGYDNPHAGKAPKSDDFMGHGGQTEIAYHGSGQAGEQGGSAPNAATGSAGPGAAPAPAAAPEAVREPRAASHGGQSFAVIEDDGSAAAETTGKVATDADYEAEQDNPGSG